MVHVAGVPAPNMCVELRGYHATQIGAGYPSVSDYPAALDRALLHTWWNSGKNQPQFTHLQRTESSSGSFTVVSPDRALLLAVAVYAHGGDFPTSIRTVGSRIEEGGEAGATARMTRNFGDGGIHSGRIYVGIELDEQIEAQGLPWDPFARSHDHSPCARKEVNDAAAADCYFVGQDDFCGDSRLPLSTRAKLTSLSSPRLVMSDSTPSGHGETKNVLDASYVAPAGCQNCDSISGGDSGTGTANDDIALVALLRSSCWNYGQLHRGLWDENHGRICSVFTPLLGGKNDLLPTRKAGVVAQTSLLDIARHGTGRISRFRWREQDSDEVAREGYTLEYFDIFNLSALVVGAIITGLALLSLLLWKYCGYNRYFEIAARDLSRNDESSCLAAAFPSPAAISSATTSNATIPLMTGTFRSADGTVSRLQMMDVNAGSGRTLPQHEKVHVFRRNSWEVERQEEQQRPDVFATIFRALSMPCDVDGLIDIDRTGSVLGMGQQHWNSIVVTKQARV